MGSHPSSPTALRPWEAAKMGSRLEDSGPEDGLTLGSLPEADDSSVFVVGTVLYRNLGSFLALQRWAAWAGPREAGGGPERPAGDRGGGGLGSAGAQGCWEEGWACPGPALTLQRLSHPARNTTVLNSKVISVTVKPPPRSLLTPLEIEFAHMYNVSGFREHACVLSRRVLREQCLHSHFQAVSPQAPRHSEGGLWAGSQRLWVWCLRSQAQPMSELSEVPCPHACYPQGGERQCAPAFRPHPGAAAWVHLPERQGAWWPASGCVGSGSVPRAAPRKLPTEGVGNPRDCSLGASKEQGWFPRGRFPGWPSLKRQRQACSPLCDLGAYSASRSHGSPGSSWGW